MNQEEILTLEKTQERRKAMLSNPKFIEGAPVASVEYLKQLIARSDAIIADIWKRQTLKAETLEMWGWFEQAPPFEEFGGPFVLTPAAIADMFTFPERYDRWVAWLIVPPSALSEISKWDPKGYSFKPESDPQLIHVGLVGYVWGTKVAVSAGIPEGTSFLVAVDRVGNRHLYKFPKTEIHSDF